MRKYGEKLSKHGAIDNQSWTGILVAAHPTKTAQGVASRTGISANTIDKWLRGLASPSFDAFVALTIAYGPEILFACAPGCAWIAKAAREERRERLERTIAEAEAERALLMEFRCNVRSRRRDRSRFCLAARLGERCAALAVPEALSAC